MDLQNMTEEELKREAQAFGEHLARLLVASSLSDEQKEAWAALVPEMSLDQLGRFAIVLERYVDPAILPEMADLRRQLEAVKADYDAKIAALNNQTQASLKAVMDEVQAIEAAAKAV
ncbi:MAG: hypothetical protein AAB337_02170 [Patescibacteria group bacterium]